MDYIDLFSESDIAELQSKVEIPARYDDDMLLIPDILIPASSHTYPRKKYVDETVSKEIIRLMVDRTHN